MKQLICSKAFTMVSSLRLTDYGPPFCYRMQSGLVVLQSVTQSPTLDILRP